MPPQFGCDIPWLCTQGFPSWQVLLVDIRCHGESASLPTPPGPHGVESSAQDILKLLSQLKLFPEVLIGHSFGGKVVMSMGEQFGASGKRLPRPVQVNQSRVSRQATEVPKTLCVPHWHMVWGCHILVDCYAVIDQHSSMSYTVYTKHCSSQHWVGSLTEMWQGY